MHSLLLLATLSITFALALPLKPDGPNGGHPEVTSAAGDDPIVVGSRSLLAIGELHKVPLPFPPGLANARRATHVDGDISAGGIAEDIGVEVGNPTRPVIDALPRELGLTSGTGVNNGESVVNEQSPRGLDVAQADVSVSTLNGDVVGNGKRGNLPNEHDLTTLHLEGTEIGNGKRGILPNEPDLAPSQSDFEGTVVGNGKRRFLPNEPDLTSSLSVLKPTFAHWGVGNGKRGILPNEPDLTPLPENLAYWRAEIEKILASAAKRAQLTRRDNGTVIIIGLPSPAIE